MLPWFLVNAIKDMLIFKHAKLLAYDMSLQSNVMLNVFNSYSYYDLFDYKLSSGLACQYKLKKIVIKVQRCVNVIHKNPRTKVFKNSVYCT